MNWFLQALKRWSDFNGRSRRMEYWMFVLFNIVIGTVLSFIDYMLGMLNTTTGVGPLGGLFSLAMLIPGIAVTIRRLHDTGRSGWWILIVLVPVIGAIWLLVLMVLDSHRETNAWGPSPKYAAA
jgi:uncharacterized membrane protein YhaH (DUF805 family)